MVGPGGLEPPTPALSTRCSNQLSYGPETKIPIDSSYEPRRSKERFIVPQKLFCVIYDGSAVSKLANKFRST